MKPAILIVDDERPTRDAMARLLSANYVCLTASDADSALATLDEHPEIAALLTDYKMPGRNGVQLIEAAKKKNPKLPAIIITAFGEVTLAVDAMKRGANDFLPKPITDFNALQLKIAALLPSDRSAKEPVATIQSAGAAFLGESEPMRRVFELIRRIAPSKASVLIEGRSGTGKELVARALHDNSPRRNGPFVAVECSALSEDVIESELFGSVKGGYTDARDRVGRFEAANGGTLFLDEIGEISPAMQVKLLRALESRTVQRVGDNRDIKVDFRLVTATNRSLKDEVVAGRFREDLFYRLDVIDIALPALKDRPGDVRLLAEHFRGEYAAANGVAVKRIAGPALAALEAYDWPGNVRELRNVMERAVVLAVGDEVTLDDLPEAIRAPRPAAAASEPTASAAPSPTNLADLEKQQILKAIQDAGGNKSKAAEALGISRRTLHRKINEWKLEA